MTSYNLRHPKGRRNAYLNMYFVDHAFLRSVFQNRHEISPGVWRSNQPSPKQLEKWKRNDGIKTIINLRGSNGYGSYALEQEACQTLGLNLINFRVKSRDMPTKKVIFGAKTLFENTEPPFLMHCKSGADRAGIMGALFKILHEQQTVKDSLEQLSLKYLHVQQGKTGMIDFFFKTAIMADANTPEAFLAWVEQEYDPALLKSQFMSKWWGRFLTDTLLKRE